MDGKEVQCFPSLFLIYSIANQSIVDTCRKMTKQLILKHAQCLSKPALTELISNLNQILLGKCNTPPASPEVFLKEVVQGTSTSSFALKEFKGYEQRKLYLTRTKGRINYTLFTVYPAGIAIVFTLANEKCNWQEEITPHVQRFFEYQR